MKRKMADVGWYGPSMFKKEPVPCTLDCTHLPCPQQAPRTVQNCNPDKAQWAVGKTNTEHNVSEARKQAGAYMVRVLRPGQAVTMEFNAERLNLEVDATGRIVAARCG